MGEYIYAHIISLSPHICIRGIQEGPRDMKWVSAHYNCNICNTEVLSFCPLLKLTTTYVVQCSLLAEFLRRENLCQPDRQIMWQGVRTSRQYGSTLHIVTSMTASFIRHQSYKLHAHHIGQEGLNGECYAAPLCASHSIAPQPRW